MAASIKSVALPPDPPLSKIAGDFADAAPLRDALQWFVRQKQWINEQHLQLCRVAASTFFEQKRAEWMLAQFRALGCVARIDRGGNVVAHPVENRTGSYIALTAHLDTVLAPRKDEARDPLKRICCPHWARRWNRFHTRAFTTTLQGT